MMLHKELMDLIMDHYEEPRNFGAMNDPDIVQKGGNPGCGDIITIYLKVDKKNIVNDIKFEGEGCIVSQSAMSIISEMVVGMSFDDVRKIDSEKMKEIFTKDLVIRRPRCANLGIDTVKTALREYEKNQKILDLNDKAI